MNSDEFPCYAIFWGCKKQLSSFQGSVGHDLSWLLSAHSLGLSGCAEGRGVIT